MICPKCKKDTGVLITGDAPRSTFDRKGLLLWIFLFPFMLIGWVFRVLIFGRTERFQKKQHWHCTYCDHDWPQEFEEKK